MFHIGRTPVNFRMLLGTGFNQVFNSDMFGSLKLFIANGMITRFQGRTFTAVFILAL